MKYAICEDCESIVEADVVNVGVGCVGHYFCCNWAHECSVYDLFTIEDIKKFINNKKDQFNVKF